MRPRVPVRPNAPVTRSQDINFAAKNPDILALGWNPKGLEDSRKSKLLRIIFTVFVVMPLATGQNYGATLDRVHEIREGAMQEQTMIKQAAREWAMREQSMQNQSPNNVDPCNKCHHSILIHPVIQGRQMTAMPIDPELAAKGKPNPLMILKARPTHTQKKEPEEMLTEHKETTVAQEMLTKFEKECKKLDAAWEMLEKLQAEMRESENLDYWEYRSVLVLKRQVSAMERQASLGNEEFESFPPCYYNLED
ncbi:hypothetical protein DUI87_12072 [Hirundo rustica rustica]|uniref:Uncharacterized protein n=1 Tax=Hirundo rustica rustica TaxID=333673 RepID=A0A3M0KDB5_HIRRU|nr:hypothetical protein DUI87_12072 [Hirundo rustica rustica]